MTIVWKKKLLTSLFCAKSFPGLNFVSNTR